MATKKILARVLASLGHLSASANDLLEGPPEHLKRMAANGQVDLEPAAVKYAQASGARVITLGDDGLLPAPESSAASDGAAPDASAAAGAGVDGTRS
jgi:hypothetical protein